MHNRSDSVHRMRYLTLAGAVCFPLLDFYLTLRFSAWSGVPAWIWFAAGVCAGLAMLASERTAFRERTLAALTGQEPLLRSLLDSGRRVLAGILFLLPGVLSDCIGLLLMLLPINMAHGLRPQVASSSRRQIFEGDYRRMD